MSEREVLLGVDDVLTLLSDLVGKGGWSAMVRRDGAIRLCRLGDCLDGTKKVHYTFSVLQAVCFAKTGKRPMSSTQEVEELGLERFVPFRFFLADRYEEGEVLGHTIGVGDGGQLRTKILDVLRPILRSF